MKRCLFAVVCLCLSWAVQAVAVRFAVIGECNFQKKTTPEKLASEEQRLKLLVDKLNQEKLDFIVQLGKLGSGHGNYEIPRVIEILRGCKAPVHYLIGGADLYPYSHEELLKLLGMPSGRYDFAVGGFRFIALDAYEQSQYWQDGTPQKAAYRQFKKETQGIGFQNDIGPMTEASWKWLKERLDAASQQGEQVIILNHVATWGGSGSGCFSKPRIPEAQRMMELLDGYANVRAYLSARYSRGAIHVRRGVLHHSSCEALMNDTLSYCIMEADGHKIAVHGFGAESDYLHTYAMQGSTIDGMAPQGCWVMTNCGDIQQVGADGKFHFDVPCRGMYSLKAVMDGCRDCFIPMIKAPANGLQVTFQTDSSRKLYTGTVDGYALLRITDDGKPVRWFDLAGTEYGSLKVPGKWCEQNTNYWAKDRYAFTATGKVAITQCVRHPEITSRGWYRGDIHAHLIHGENFYRSNVMMMAFIARAEGYDWLYSATGHGNDGDSTTDVFAFADKVSDGTFLYRMNQEYPKNRSNHFGNCGVTPPMTGYDMEVVSSLEIAERFIWQHGGITVPVHPFYSHMAFRELCLWLLCAPEKIPCMDFFYFPKFPKPMEEGYWFMLLNRGYEIGCFATSDASFDVGRTPGHHRGSNYLPLKTLTEAAIQQAILQKRTMVSYEGAAVLFSIDDAISGEHLSADGKLRTLTVELYWQHGQNGRLRVVRNGVDIHTEDLAFKADHEPIIRRYPVAEQDNAWYLVILETTDGTKRAVASPIYFRNAAFKAPENLPFPRPVPRELLAECQALTPEQLAKPETLDYFASRLRELATVRKEAVKE